LKALRAIRDLWYSLNVPHLLRGFGGIAVSIGLALKLGFQPRGS